MPSSRTLIAAEPHTQGAEAVFLYARLTVHIWQCRCVILRHRTAGGNSTDPAWARTRAFAAGTCLPLPLLPEGCGRRHPPRLFSCWKCSLRGWPAGLGALARVLGPYLGHGAALFPAPRVSSQLTNCAKQSRHNAGRKVKAHHNYCPQATGELSTNMGESCQLSLNLSLVSW